MKLPGARAAIFGASGWYRGRARGSTAGSGGHAPARRSVELLPSPCVLPGPWAGAAAEWCGRPARAPADAPRAPTEPTPHVDRRRQPDGPPDLTIDSYTIFSDFVETHLAAAASAGATSIVVATATGFDRGTKILVITVRGSSGDAGVWELATVASVSGTTLTLDGTLAGAYPDPEQGVTLVRSMPQYADVTITPDGTLAAPPWDPVLRTGGIVAFFASGTVTVDGTLSAKGCGYTGGVLSSQPNQYEFKAQGESYPGAGASSSTLNQSNAGGGNGGAKQPNDYGGGGGGGGYADFGTTGDDGSTDAGGGKTKLPGGAGGSKYGDDNLDRMYFGSGGGSGGTAVASAGQGGSGGGIILVVADTISVNGSIDASGNPGAAGNNDGGGGGGSGGSVYLRAPRCFTGTHVILTGGTGGKGDAGGGAGGAGAAGRFHADTTGG